MRPRGEDEQHENRDQRGAEEIGNGETREIIGSGGGQQKRQGDNDQDFGDHGFWA